MSFVKCRHLQGADSVLQIQKLLVLLKNWWWWWCFECKRTTWWIPLRCSPVNISPLWKQAESVKTRPSEMNASPSTASHILWNCISQNRHQKEFSQVETSWASIPEMRNPAQLFINIRSSYLWKVKHLFNGEMMFVMIELFSVGRGLTSGKQFTEGWG